MQHSDTPFWFRFGLAALLIAAILVYFLLNVVIGWSLGGHGESVAHVESINLYPMSGDYDYSPRPYSGGSVLVSPDSAVDDSDSPAPTYDRSPFKYKQGGSDSPPAQNKHARS